ncbi:sodium:solute symporter [uncultured Cytophaga sp.]|uniref:sodium:solute symporter n=1 Tax=uncultured Cytophaga sp. TaxID=160238 RepID=UPI002638E069|nr:sodium:solute symporter [uncultured Cytophaga sp.]
MSFIDWAVLAITIISIVVYGLWKSRGAKNIEGYLLADKELPWYQVGLSVMATQASAITFISLPGQAYSDGMGFVQMYFGLPLATIILCKTFIPIFRNLNVYTAYEYLENRFDSKTRSFTAFLFLVQRGISTGITIYAPSIILSTILDIHITYTTLFTGGLVISYIVYGGTKAVAYTQMFQMAIIFSGLFIAAFMVVHLLPEEMGLVETLHLAGKMDKLNAINLSFNINDPYNVWSGLIGGFFLQLSYLGTDQSQVGRYLTGKSIKESRLGLVMNSLIKIPMQFSILLIGILVFVFYQFNTPPLFFNKTEVARIETSIHAQEYHTLEAAHKNLYEVKKNQAQTLVQAIKNHEATAYIDQAQQELHKTVIAEKKLKKEATDLMTQNDSLADTNDTNYVFLTFVTTYLPVGLVGLLIAIILLASMGSTASGINSLASTSIVDFYKRFVNKTANPQTYLNASRWATAAWGVFCVVVALYAGQLGNLIEAVNKLGSLFYGNILGIFLVAFYLKQVKGSAVFYAAIVTEIFIIAIWWNDLMAYLWLNAIGCMLVMLISLMMQYIQNTFSKVR